MAKTRDDSNQSTHIFLSISRDFFVLSLSFLPSCTSVSPFFSFFFLLGRIRVSPTMTTTTTTPFVDIRSHWYSFCLATRIIVRVNRSLAFLANFFSKAVATDRVSCTSFFLYLRTFSLFRFAFFRLFDVVCRVSCNTFERRADAGVDKRINSMCNVKVRHRPLLFLLANSRKLPFLESMLTQQFAQKRVFLHLFFPLFTFSLPLDSNLIIISSFVQYYRSRSRSRSLSACLACLLLLRVLLVKCARTDASAAFLIEPWKRHGATFPYSSGDFCTLPALRRIRSSLFRRFLTRIVSFFFLSTENDLHRNLRLNIGRDINRHNNRKRTELKNSRNAR